MSPPLAEAPPPTERPTGPSARHLFDRAPLLIPQLFVDGKPWYKRRDVHYRIAAAAVFALALALVVRRYSVEGLLRGIASLGGG